MKEDQDRECAVITRSDSGTGMAVEYLADRWNKAEFVAENEFLSVSKSSKVLAQTSASSGIRKLWVLCAGITSGFILCEHSSS